MSESARTEALAAGARPERTSVVYIGLERRFDDPPPGVVRDPHQVITVAYVDEVSWSRKGIDRFVEAARHDPGRRYILVGRIADDLHSDAFRDPPANLVLAGYVDDDQLRDLLWSSGVYAQLSWHEGFGVSMVEAMQAGCRPVVTDLPALREIAGPGAVVSHDRTEDVAAIDQAATLDTDRAALASWASSVTCMETRASGLEQALFGAA
jgi:glycosyltransferase involved in cell wall biosynthesis